jgi:hypothetical protein
MIKRINVTAEVDSDDVLDELNTEDIIEYLKIHRGVGVDTSTHSSDLVNDFFHGDFDLKELLLKIGKEAVTPVLTGFIKEQGIEIV